MKKFISMVTALATAVILLTSAAPKPTTREAVFQANLHCKNCANKIRENVSFEKGVKDLTIDLEAKTVTIVYQDKKTDTKHLAEAIEKLGFKVQLVQDKAL